MIGNANDAKVDTRITTAKVLAAIDCLTTADFTTFEVAAAMGVAEYPVRAAVSWLLKFGAVKRDGAKECWTKPVKRERCHYRPGKCEPYYATTYVRVVENTVDFDALYRAMCGLKGVESDCEENAKEAG